MLPLAAGLVGMVVPVGDLPGVQRRPAERARLGRRDVDRHRARPRPARDARPRRAGPGAGVPADGLRRRRPRRAARDRRRLQRADRRAAAGAGRGGVRAAAGRVGSGRCGSRSVYFALGLVIWSRCWPAASTRSSPGWPSGCPHRRTRRAAATLEEATGLVRQFREQPTPELARAGDRRPHRRRCRRTPGCRRFYHPWTSYVIVPLFALANAGIALIGRLPRARVHRAGHARRARRVRRRQAGRAWCATSWAVTRLSRGRVRPPVGWAAVLGSGTIAGIGFTVALLIATRAFHGARARPRRSSARSRRSSCPRR